jgi:uncharacterized protein YegP (UPF0339 family)
MIIRIRHTSRTGGYWFQLALASGQIIAASAEYNDRAAISAVVKQLMEQASAAKISDLTFDTDSAE